MRPNLTDMAPTKSNDRLVVLPTKPTLLKFRQRMGALSNVNYDLNEIGYALVEAMNQDPTAYPYARQTFAESYSAVHQGDDEKAHAFIALTDLFHDVHLVMELAKLETLAGHDYLGMSFHSWLAHDLVVMQHRLPY